MKGIRMKKTGKKASDLAGVMKKYPQAEKREIFSFVAAYYNTKEKKVIDVFL